MRCTMWGRYLFLYPLFTAIGTMVGFLISYGISISQGHVEPFVPYISNTGALPPESCVFGQFLNFFALLLGITLYIRYRQIDEELTTSCPFGEQLRKIAHRLNITSLISAIIITPCLSIVANFQYRRSQGYGLNYIHLTAAYAAYLLVALHLCIDTWFTFKIVSLATRPVIKYLRVILTSLLVINIVITGVGTLIAYWKYTGEANDGGKWSAHHNGYAEHIMATSAQWILTVAIMLYIITFVNDFRKIGLKPPEPYIVRKNCDISDGNHESYTNHGSDVNRETHVIRMSDVTSESNTGHLSDITSESNTGHVSDIHRGTYVSHVPDNV